MTNRNRERNQSKSPEMKIIIGLGAASVALAASVGLGLGERAEALFSNQSDQHSELYPGQTEAPNPSHDGGGDGLLQKLRHGH